jgi:HEPN domain-containing protein
MISATNLRKLARARLEDARALLNARRYDGAVYLGGYVVEIALKARICRTLRWSGFPETRQEFHAFASFRTHNLDVLLALSGRERRVKATHIADWWVAATWDPEIRYRLPGSTEKANAELLLRAAETLLAII